MFFKKLDVQQKTVDFVQTYTSKATYKMAHGLWNSLPESTKSGISADALNQELAAIQLELFSTAVAVRNMNKAIEQSIFLKKYLHEQGMDNYWAAMQPYNDVIAKLATMGLDSTTAKGRFKLSYITDMRYGMAKSYISKHGIDSADEAVGRAINRFGVAPSKLSASIAAEFSNRTGVSMITLPTYISAWYKNAYAFVKK